MRAGLRLTSGRRSAHPARLAVGVLPFLVAVAWLIGPAPAYAAPSIVVSDATPSPVPEGNAGTTNASFSITLSETPAADVSVSYASMYGSATAGTDYVYTEASVTFAAGATGPGLVKTVTVAVNGDTTPEPDENFFVQLYSPTGGATIADAFGQAVIQNDDAAPVTISVSDATPSPVTEGNSGTTNASFDIVVSASPSGPVTFSWATNYGTATADTDYVYAQGTGTFASGTGTLTQTVTIQVKGDTTPEGDETFFLQLYDVGGATVGTTPADDGFGQATIQNDDVAVPIISIADVTTVEGTTAQVPVTLSFAPPGPVTVQFVTMHNTYFDTNATAGSDYTAQAGTLSWTAGDPMLTKTIDLPLVADGSPEPSERFYVQIYDPVGGNLAAIRYGKVSISAPPTAANDSYTAVGNTKLVVEAVDPAEPRRFQATGDPLENDSDPEGDTLTVSGPATTTNGGTLTLNPTGSFVYLPAVGFTGVDGFTYDLSDGNGNTVTGTVTITVANKVWYVNNAVGAGDGRSNSPFNSLASVSSGGDPDGPGDYIFLFQGGGTYAGGLVLEASQRLIGQPEGLVVGADTLFAAGGTNPVITNAAGNGIQLANDTVIRRVNVTGTSGAGMQGNAVNNVDIGPNLTVTNSTGAGISFFNPASGTISVGANITHSSGSGRSFFVANRSGGTVTMSGTINDTAGGVQFDLNTGATINVTGALTLIGPTETFKATGGGTVTANNSANTLSNTTAAALNVNATTIGAAGLTFQSINSSGGASGILLSGTGSSGGLTVTGTGGAGSGGTIQSKSGAGISLTNVGGAVSLTNMATTTVAGADVLASGGGANLTYTGTISNASGRSIDISSKSGGTVLFSGAITDSGTGISLSSNGGTTMSFTGGLTLSTGANPAFAATGGGTVNVTGSTNTITTSTGTALNVTNTTIGGSGITFRSISANGGSNGIVLDGAGTGGLTVTGTGSAGSGGTIQNMTGADGSTAGTGVRLNNVSNVSLSWMHLHDFSNFAIRGTTVSGFTLARTTINGTNGGNAAVDEGSIAFNELTGSANINNSTIQGGIENNLKVTNTGGSLNRLTLDVVTLGAVSNADGDDNVLVQNIGSGTLNVTVQNSFLTNARGDHFQLAAGGTVASDLVFTGNAVSNNHANVLGGGGVITVTVENSADMTYNISSNTIRDSKGSALIVGKAFGMAPGNGTMSGRIESNTIGVSGVANSGSSEGSGIDVGLLARGTHTTLIKSNQIRRYSNHGILVTAGGASQSVTGVLHDGALNVTIQGNTIAEPNAPGGGLAQNGVHLNSGTNSTGGNDAYAVCMAIGDPSDASKKNTLTGSGALGGTDYRLRQRFDTTVRLPGYTGASTGPPNADLTTYLTPRTSGAFTLSSATTGPPGGFFNTNPAGSACPLPA